MSDSFKQFAIALLITNIVFANAIIWFYILKLMLDKLLLP